MPIFFGLSCEAELKIVRLTQYIYIYVFITFIHFILFVNVLSACM